MKLLVYGLNYAPELIGVATYTREMCEWLAARGHTVKVVTSYPYYPNWKIAPPYRASRYSREHLNGVDLIRCPIYVPSVPSGTGRMLHHLSFAASSGPVMAGLATRFRPDVLMAIAPSLLVAPTALASARLAHARSWLHVQDFEVESAFQLGILSGSRLRRGAERAEAGMLKRFDRISTISPRMVARLAAKQIPEERLVEFRNWVDTAVIRPRSGETFRSKLGLSPDAVVALYSGSMALKQGLECLVDAARALRHVRPELVFVLCGQGAMRDRLAHLAGDVDNIRFLDLQPQELLPDLLAAADIHLLPQRAEVADLVLPSKLAPMLASGRPIVAMAAEGTQLAAEVQGAGLVIKPGDTQGFMDALARLAQDPALRGELGRRGRAAAEARWDGQAILGRLEARLMALAEQSAQPAPSAAAELELENLSDAPSAIPVRERGMTRSLECSGVSNH